MDSVGKQAIRAEGGETETVVEILFKFLQGEEAGAPAPLVSVKGDDGKTVLRSYGVSIAELGEDGVVVVKVLGDDTMIPVRRKHLKWLEVMAQEKGKEVVSSS